MPRTVEEVDRDLDFLLIQIELLRKQIQELEKKQEIYTHYHPEMNLNMVKKS